METIRARPEVKAHEAFTGFHGAAASCDVGPVASEPSGTDARAIRGRFDVRNLRAVGWLYDERRLGAAGLPLSEKNNPGA